MAAQLILEYTFKTACETSKQANLKSFLTRFILQHNISNV